MRTIRTGTMDTVTTDGRPAWAGHYGMRADDAAAMIRRESLGNAGLEEADVDHLVQLMEDTIVFRVCLAREDEPMVLVEIPHTALGYEHTVYDLANRRTLEREAHEYVVDSYGYGGMWIDLVHLARFGDSDDVENALDLVHWFGDMLVADMDDLHEVEDELACQDWEEYGAREILGYEGDDPLGLLEALVSEEHMDVFYEPGPAAVFDVNPESDEVRAIVARFETADA